MTDQSDDTFKVGQEGCFKRILVRISKIDGGVFTLKTPHSSEIQVGFFFMTEFKPFTAAQKAQYDEWIVDAKDKGVYEEDTTN